MEFKEKADPCDQLFADRPFLISYDLDIYPKQGNFQCIINDDSYISPVLCPNLYSFYLITYYHLN